MLEFTFSTDDLANTSLALSPLWELVCSLRVLQAPDPDAMSFPWVERVMPRVRALPEMALLMALVPPGKYLPDFLTPPPSTPLPDLASELEALEASSAARVRNDLRKAYPKGLPGVLLAIDDHPRSGLRRIVEALLAYWDVALAEHWPRLRDVLQSDIGHRGREFASGGAARLFRELHPSVTWKGESLVVDKECSLQLDLGGDGLLLVPSAFAWPIILTITAAPLRNTLIYPARGVALLWDDGPLPSSTGLARLIGPQRAALLASLSGTATTTELARRHGLTAGGVSQHLSVLRDAGLVTGSRAGRVVLYTRTPLGATIAESGPRSTALDGNALTTSRAANA